LQKEPYDAGEIKLVLGLVGVWLAWIVLFGLWRKWKSLVQINEPKSE
jgi:hypothetical protein